MTELPKRLEEEIQKIVNSEGLELVHVDYRPAGTGLVLRVDIDKEGESTSTTASWFRAN